MIRRFLVVLALLVCLVSQSCADVATLRQYRLQRQQQQVQQEIPYPAAGYRPGRQFFLPQEQPQNDETDFANAADTQQQYAEQSQSRRPDLIYGAPSQAPAQFPSQSARLIQEQRFFTAPQRLNAAPAFGSRRKSQRLIAAPIPQVGRLVANSENLPEDDEDEVETDIDVKTENVPRTVAPVPSPQPTTVYYPAGAVSFVHPLSGATYVQTTQAQAPNSVAPIAQPFSGPVPVPAAAAYVQAPQYSNYPFQPVSAPFSAAPVAVAAPVSATAPIVPAQPLQGQTISPARQTAQPAVAAPATVAVTAPFYPSPAAFAAAPNFYSTPTAAYTAAFAQPQYYASAPTQLTAAPIMSPAQLQTW